MSLTCVYITSPLLSRLHFPFQSLALWRHQMETFSALLAICAGNSPLTSEFPAQRPVTRSFDVFFDLRLNERLSKQSSGWWFETPSRPLWRHSNGRTASRYQNARLKTKPVSVEIFKFWQPTSRNPRMDLKIITWFYFTWWRHQVKISSALLVLCEGNPPVPGGFPSQRPGTRSFEDFFDRRLNKRLSKQSRRWWFETPSRSLWRHWNVILLMQSLVMRVVLLLTLLYWHRGCHNLPSEHHGRQIWLNNNSCLLIFHVLVYVASGTNFHRTHFLCQ